MLCFYLTFSTWVFGMTRPGIEPRSPGPLVNTLHIRPMTMILTKTILILAKINRTKTALIRAKTIIFLTRTILTITTLILTKTVLAKTAIILAKTILLKTTIKFCLKWLNNRQAQKLVCCWQNQHLHEFGFVDRCWNVWNIAKLLTCGVWKLWRSRAKGNIWLHILVILFYPTLTGRRKESPKRNIQKEKIEIDKRRKHFFYTFLYLLGEGTNRHYVPRRRHGAQNTRQQNGLVGSTDTSWKAKIISSPFSKGMPFFFYACVISFSVRDLWEFLQI